MASNISLKLISLYYNCKCNNNKLSQEFTIKNNSSQQLSHLISH